MSDKYKQMSKYAKRDEMSGGTQITVMHDALVSPVLICLISDIVNPASKRGETLIQRAHVSYDLHIWRKVHHHEQCGWQVYKVQSLLGASLTYIHMLQVDIT